jgi:hypothetical protein
MVHIPPTWTYEDHGKAGEASWEAADGTHVASTRRFRDWLDTYSASANDVFVFLWGTNDVRKTGWRAMLQDDTAAAVQQIVEDAVATGRPVVLATPPPIIPSDEVPSGHPKTETDEFNDNLKLLAAIADGIASSLGIGRATLYDHFIALPGWGDELIGNLDYYRLCCAVEWADGVHPGNHLSTPSGEPGQAHVAEPIVSALVGGPVPVPALDTPGRWTLLAALLGAASRQLGRRWEPRLAPSKA